MIKRLLHLPFVVWIAVAGVWGWLNYTTGQTEIYEPAVANLESKKIEIESLKTQVKKAEQFRQERDKKLEEMQQLAKTLEASAAKLPKSPSVPALIKSISQISERSGLDLILLKPADSTERSFLSVTPLDVELKGSYVQVMSFFDSVARVPRIIHIDSLKMNQGKLGPNGAILSVTARLVTYHFESNPADLVRPSGDQSKKPTGQGG